MTIRISRVACAGLMMAGSLASLPANAALMLQGSRLIYPEEKREITARLEHAGEAASIVQAWIDDGDATATPANAKAPFLVRPPIFRLDAGKTQILRISSLPQSLPKDRESLFWFNAREVPTETPGSTDAEGSSKMHFIVRTRVKLLYRPKGLTALAANQAPRQLGWRVEAETGGCALVAMNSTPYHVSLNSIAAGHEKISVGDGVVAPMQEQRFQLSASQCQSVSSKVTFEYINDYGAVNTHEASVRRN